MRHPAPRSRPFSLLLLVAATLLGLAACDTDDGDPADGDTDTTPDTLIFDGPDIVPDTGADTSADMPHQDVPRPGECFEVFGPPGIVHDEPRQHDAGVVVIGESVTREVRFYNFCSDLDAMIVGTEVLSADAGLEVVIDGPPDGVAVGQERIVTVTLTPAAAGMQQATVRFEVDHGYYDFTLALEAIAADGAPAPLVADCLALESDALDLGEVAVAGSAEQSLLLSALPGCELPFGLAHLAIDASIEGGDGAFSLVEAATSTSSDAASLVLFESADETTQAFVRVRFAPTTSGAHAAELVLTTNEPVGEHRIALSGSAP